MAGEAARNQHPAGTNGGNGGGSSLATRPAGGCRIVCKAHRAPLWAITRSCVGNNHQFRMPLTSLPHPAATRDPVDFTAFFPSAKPAHGAEAPRRVSRQGARLGCGNPEPVDVSGRVDPPRLPPVNAYRGRVAAAVAVIVAPIVVVAAVPVVNIVAGVVVPRANRNVQVRHRTPAASVSPAFQRSAAALTGNP